MTGGHPDPEHGPPRAGGERGGVRGGAHRLPGAQGHLPHQGELSLAETRSRDRSAHL